MVHDSNHAIYLAETFDVKAKAVDTNAKPPEASDIKLAQALNRAGKSMTIRFDESARTIAVNPQPTKVNTKRLMIVDDQDEMRTLLAEYFRRLGFEVAEKEIGAAALQIVTTESFDCFILDVFGSRHFCGAVRPPFTTAAKKIEWRSET